MIFYYDHEPANRDNDYKSIQMASGTRFYAAKTENESYILQVSPEDCTGCDLCVVVCPAVSKEKENFKSINMRKKISESFR
jgi:ferredoxin